MGVLRLRSAGHSLGLAVAEAFKSGLLFRYLHKTYGLRPFFDLNKQLGVPRLIGREKSAWTEHRSSG